MDGVSRVRILGPLRGADPREIRGNGILVVKVMNSWPACPEFEPSTAKDPPWREGRYTLNMSGVKRPSVGVVGKLGEGGASSNVPLVT
ncbi:hypothetical protein TNCV_5063841 [Trichonephila clavipes]|nr:hypothetical protein TNCV_5063841 [Trichonephila clavipes]